jgi:hypothetical protein
MLSHMIHLDLGKVAKSKTMIKKWTTISFKRVVF